jgi:ribose transport system permease protein
MNAKAATVESKLNWKKTGTFLYNNLIVIGIILLAVYAAISEPRYFTFDNLENIIRQLGALSMTAIGMTFVIIAGYIDLSIVGMFSFVSVFTLSLVPVFGEIPALLMGMALGTLCGVLDAVILSFVGAKDDADAVFLTFGMSTVFFALALLWSGGSTIRLTTITPIAKFLGKGEILGLPSPFFLFLILLVIAHIFLMKTKTGAEIRLSGGNRQAARLSGISSRKAIIISFAVLGFTVALGSIIQFTRTTAAGPTNGTGFETNSILAVVIGGTRLKGGLGSVLRTTIGIVLVTAMSNALNLIGVPTNLQDLFKGAILVLAIWLDYRRK